MRKISACLTTLCLYLLCISAAASAAVSGGSAAAELLVKGRALARTGKLAEALTTFRTAVTYAEQSGEDFLAAAAFHNLAEVYRLQGYYPQALYSYRQAVSLYYALGNDPAMALAQRRIEEIAAVVPGAKDMPDLDRAKLIEEAVERIRKRLEAAREEKKTFYLLKVKQMIVERWQPPEVMTSLADHGEVAVALTIQPDGNVADVTVSGSSGEPTVDREALRAVYAAAPFGPSPTQRPWPVQISLRYLLKRGMAAAPAAERKFPEENFPAESSANR